MVDIKYMQMAYDLAEKGRGLTSPNPFVGAIIVKNNKIVGQGYTQPAGQAHAEIQALNMAGLKAKDAIMYVTLEPCVHYGRTLPCVDAILKEGIKEIIIGIKDPNPLVNGKGIDVLKRNGIKVKIGVLKQKILKQNEVFIKYITKNLPFICIKTAMSLDGKITHQKGRNMKMTGIIADKFVHQLRGRYDSIMVGTNTVLIDNPCLTNRGGGRNPIRVLLDKSGKIPLEAYVFKQNAPIFLITSNQNQKKYPDYINIINVPVLKSGDLSLKVALRKIAQIGVSSVLVEGGAKLNTSLVNQNLADKFIFIYTPRIIGQSTAPSVFGGMGNVITAQVMMVQLLGEDILVEGGFGAS